MIFFLPGKRAINLSGAKEIGSGAGGIVFDYPEGAGEFSFKLYLEPTAGLKRRFEGLRLLPPARWTEEGGVSLAWPYRDLTDASGRFVGFDMPRVNGESLYGLIDPGQRDEIVENATWATLVMVAERIARMMARLHHAAIVIGDVSPANILVDSQGRVTFIDCDSYQFIDPRPSREGFPALNITPEYTSPEAIAAPGAWLSHHHDVFGLAIIVCQLLMEGEHPYEGVPMYGAASTGTVGNILTGTSRHFGPYPMKEVAGTIGLDIMPHSVRELARRCFQEGHQDPTARPSAAEWSTTLQKVSTQLVGCPRNSRHVTWAGRNGCFWCDRVQAGFAEHYPAAGRHRQRPVRFRGRARS